MKATGTTSRGVVLFRPRVHMAVYWFFVSGAVHNVLVFNDLVLHLSFSLRYPESIFWKQVIMYCYGIFNVEAPC